MLRRLAVAVVLLILTPIALAQEDRHPTKRLPGQVPPKLSHGRAEDQLEQKRAAKEVSRSRTKHTVDRYLQYYSRMYKLDEKQKAQFRQTLEDLAEQQSAFIRDWEPKFIQLQEKVRSAQEQAKSTEVSKDVQEELRRALENMRAEMPLNDDKIRITLEAMLPAEQVEAGRERLEDHRNRQKQQTTARDERRIMERDALGGMYRVEAPAKPKVARSEGAKLAPAPPARETPKPVEATPQPRRPSGDLQTKVLSPWEEYGERFIAHFRLDPAQQEAVRQIVKDLMDRRADYDAKHAADYQALENMTDPKRRAEEQAALDRPINEMFEELPKRLNDIPTTAQLENCGEFK